MATKSNDALIQEVIDREAIRTLPVRYCHCVWQKDVGTRPRKGNMLCRGALTA